MAIFVATARTTPSRNVWSPERTSNDLAVGGLLVVGATKLVVVCASNKRLVVSLILAAALAVDAVKCGCAMRLATKISPTQHWFKNRLLSKSTAQLKDLCGHTSCETMATFIHLPKHGCSRRCPEDASYASKKRAKDAFK